MRKGPLLWWKFWPERSKIRYMKNNTLTAIRNKERLDGLACCLKLTDAIDRLMEETAQRA